MPVALAPFPVYRAANNNGLMLAGGLVDTFAAGTFTPLATYADPAGATPNPNPVVLDASGRANIYFTIGVAYKIRQRDSTGVTLWTVDNFLVSPQGDPTLINDFSATVTQSEQTLDPGEVGTEVLAQSLSDEIAELRFVIKEMKGTPTSWRTSNATRHQPVSATQQSQDDAMWPHGSLTTWILHIMVPDGYVSNTTLVFRIVRRATAPVTGTAIMYWTYYHHVDGQPQGGIGNVAMNFSPGDGNDHFTSLTLPTPTLGAGDYVRVGLTRLGTDPGDTMTGAVILIGAWLEYTGVASR